ncbi:GNAT family N-acetyltransferase [Streptomyces sp. NPDC046631]|uniref:GNAT family N-acetyltransferase n=1 Tax=unclassified Streptomyces TaxID=2593676 RepID=UPI00340F8DE4
MHSAQQARHADDRFNLAISADGHQALGEVLLNCATGSIVGAAHRGQRPAVRTLPTMTEFAYTTIALPRVILEIEPDNHPSIAVARSAGFYPTSSAPRPSLTRAGRARAPTRSCAWGRPRRRCRRP